jgi:hypothetical protein
MRDFDKAESLFHQALGLPEPDRLTWLEARCAGDVDLLDEVSSLLDAHKEMSRRFR